MEIYIDRAYTVDINRKWHSGLFITMGREAIINITKKLELAIRNSIEMKVTSNREIFPKYTWFRYFYLVQGSDSKENILF